MPECYVMMPTKGLVFTGPASNKQLRIQVIKTSNLIACPSVCPSVCPFVSSSRKAVPSQPSIADLDYVVFGIDI